MIDYLTHPRFLNYDPSVLTSSQVGGSGVESLFLLNMVRQMIDVVLIKCLKAGFNLRNSVVYLID